MNLNKIRKETVYSIILIGVIITILVTGQAGWVLWNYQKNYIWSGAGKYFDFYDTMFFRVSMAAALGLIVGIPLALILRKVVNPEWFKRLALSTAPLYLLWLTLIRGESNFITVFHQLLPLLIVVLSYVFLEWQILIPESRADFKRKVIPALRSSSFVVLTLCYFIPLQVFLSNPSEFYFVFWKLLFYLIPVAAFGILLIARILILFPDNKALFKKALVVSFALGLGLWLQTNVMAWNYGIIDGSRIDWLGKWYFGAADLSVWLVLIGLALFLPEKLTYSFSQKAVVYFILLQIVFTALFVLQTPVNKGAKESSFRGYTVDESDKFTFSKNTNVIVLILDEFQSDIFQESVSASPGLKKNFDGFTYYPNATSALSFTSAAIPAILTGVMYDNSIPTQEYIEKNFLNHSILRTLMDNGFQVDIYPWDADSSVFFDPRVVSNLKKRGEFIEVLKELSYLYDFSLFRALPHFIKPAIYNNFEWFLYRQVKNWNFKVIHERRVWDYGMKFPKNQIMYDNNINFIYHMVVESSPGADRNVFKLFHVQGAHVPINLNGNFESDLYKYNRQTYKGVAEALLKLTSVFLDQLKREGLYDNSLIFIIGDHGSGRTPDMYEPPQFDKTNIGYNTANSSFFRTRGIPLVLIKPFQSRGGLITRRSPVSLLDIPLTIAGELNIKSGLSGEDMVKIPENQNRVRYYRSFDYEDHPDKNYLAPLSEWEINGDSWRESSWRKTGRVFNPRNNKK